jgi:hypothetical protein
MTAGLLFVPLLCISIFACCTSACADRRVALVIGNSEYGSQAQLTNPRNDGQDMAEALKALDFDVILRVDADRQHFLQALEEFSRAAAGADVGLFFYAGHGIQMDGSNYLVPVDAQVRDEISVRFALVPLEEVQRALARTAGPRILILDACRNNPFMAQLSRSLKASNRDTVITRGLAPVEQVRGNVVAYATQPNDIAADGDERNSPFTGALLASLREPGLEIGAMFRKVAARVNEKTHGKQVPELSISLLTDVYLNRGETDAQVWARVRAANDPAGLRDFLARFPASFYAADARLRLDLLEKDHVQPPAPAPLPPVAAVNPDRPPAAEPSGMDEAQRVVGIKTELRRLGCYVDPIDANWNTPALRKAITDFATRTHLAKIPNSPAQPFLDDLKSRSGQICAPACGPREQESDGRCVPKACAANEVLNRSGTCVARIETAPPDQRRPGAPSQGPHRRPDPAAPPANHGRCFNFNGQQFCE